MTLWLAAVAALALALVSAALLSRRAPGHRPVVALLALGLVVDLTVETIRHALTRPLAGIDLALYHASNALVTAWPCGIAAAAWWAFYEPARRRALPVIAALWVLANGLLIAGPLRREPTQRGLLVVEVVALAAVALAVGVGWRRPWTWPHRALLWLAVVEVVVVTLGPFRGSVYTDWDLARVAYGISFAVLAVLQGAAWYRLRPQQAGSDGDP